MDSELKKLINRAEKLSSPNQTGYGTKANQDAINRLRNRINNLKKAQRKKKSTSLKIRKA